MENIYNKQLILPVKRNNCEEYNKLLIIILIASIPFSVFVISMSFILIYNDTGTSHYVYNGGYKDISEYRGGTTNIIEEEAYCIKICEEYAGGISRIKAVYHPKEYYRRGFGYGSSCTCAGTPILDGAHRMWGIRTYR